jgi:hypothetical protein
MVKDAPGVDTDGHIGGQGVLLPAWRRVSCIEGRRA